MFVIRMITKLALVALALMASAFGSTLDLPDQPLFLAGSNTSLIQLVIERDNKLFFEAYPSYQDFNGDGIIDNRYKPDEIDYAGYFHSYFCYAEIPDSHFEAFSSTPDKKCPGQWSGDFLNYLTMSRMDIIRSALYGGLREIDTNSTVRLRRAFIPTEYHTWGIDYTSIEKDNYDIRHYSPYDLPRNGKQHWLATNNRDLDDTPYLRVRLNQRGAVWQWVEAEYFQAAGSADHDLVVKVTVCKSGFLEPNCKQYPGGNYKPTGLLHEFSENDLMYFSLLTGSYENNIQGGVLRQQMRSFLTHEVEPVTGAFLGSSGIVSTLNAIQIPNNYHPNYMMQLDCGFAEGEQPVSNGTCRAWGNPVAEMMYEGLRYFSGTETPTSSFDTTGGMDAALGLDSKTWDNPFSTSQPYGQCSDGYQLVISDPSPTYDGDNLPGSDFGTFTDSTLGSLHVGNLADYISSHEIELPGMKFIGQVGANNDRAPTVKNVTSFRNIRGPVPEAPHREGSYYAASVSYYGHQNDLNNAPGDQKIGNFTMALGSSIPTIDVPVNGQVVSFAPFARVVSAGQPLSSAGTSAILSMIVEEQTPTSGSFRVSFEDKAHGGDSDMDAVVRYSYDIVNGNIVMTTESIYSVTGLIMHLGYTVSGTTDDGVYLVVRDFDTPPEIDVDYHLDVPPGGSPGVGWTDSLPLPLIHTKIFTVSAASAAERLKPPLWYAAKWGGFSDTNNDGVPQPLEWDADQDGNPDNYFPVTNPSETLDLMRSALNQINQETAAATSIAVTGGSLKTGSRIYQTEFQSGTWNGEVSSYEISTTGELSSSSDWNASVALAGQISADSRNILTYNPVQESGVAFRWPTNPASPTSTELSAGQVTALSHHPINNIDDGRGAERVDYVRGEAVDGFRERVNPLGDIVHSSPVLVGPPQYFYPDDWGPSEPESTSPYSSFGMANADRQRVVYVGVNDGMLHAFDAGSLVNDEWTAGSGEELFAYIPAASYKNLAELTYPAYSHKYFVDATPRAGDVYFDSSWHSVLTGGLRSGGQAVFALDITDPDAIAESTADSTVLWEFDDSDDADMGYSYVSPLIVRMHNKRWAAVFGNGYNSTEADDHVSSTGQSVLFIVDIETGNLIKKIPTGSGTPANPNGLSEPTAIDLDGDLVVDIIYAGDLHGKVWAFDVSSPATSGWGVVGGDEKFQTSDENNASAAITSAIAVGSHPSGEGVMLYVGSGKFIEHSDQFPSPAKHRIYGLWDEFPFNDADLTSELQAGNMLEQSIVNEFNLDLDTDNDGFLDTTHQVRETSQHSINWGTDSGWYIDLEFGSYMGEQVVAAPLLREGRLIVNTHIPNGDPCAPGEGGWLMIFDAVSGSMLPENPLDLDNDGVFSGTVSGVRNVGNPLASPTIVSTGTNDLIITQTAVDPTVTATALEALLNAGRIRWRELEP